MRIELEDNKNTVPEEPVKVEEPVKFSDLSGRKRAEYIWDYYKWWFIGGLIAIVLLVTFIRDYRENSKPTYLYVEMLNTYFGYDKTNTLYDDYAEAAAIDLTKEHLTIGTDTTLSVGNFDTTMIAFQQRLMANYAAQEIDVVIGPKNIIEGPANCDCYANFDEIIPQDLKDELIDREYEFWYFEGYSAGVYLDNCSYLNNMGESGAYPVNAPEDERPVFTIAANSQRIDHAVEFLRFLVHNH